MKIFLNFLKKSVIILFLYSGLRSQQGVCLEKIIKENYISLSSFRRYIRDIDCYLAETFSGKEVTYSAMKNRYFITAKNNG